MESMARAHTLRMQAEEKKYSNKLYYSSTNSRRQTPNKVEAEKLASEELYSNDIKYGSNEDFDVFDIAEDEKVSKTAEDAYTPTSLSLTSENIQLQCRTCFKWIDICWYKKHYVAHIYEKSFFVRKMKDNLSPEMQDEATQLGRSVGSKTKIATYRDQILNPKTDEDFELLHYIYQANEKGYDMDEIDKMIKIKLIGFIYVDKEKRK